MFKAGFLWLMLLSSIANAKIYRVAVIDSGYSGSDAKICDSGSFDFIVQKPIVGQDRIPHGTIISNIIASGNDNYCIMVLRIFSGRANSKNYTSKAILRAIAEHADVINMSLEGPDFDDDEYIAMRLAVANGIKIFVASGNTGKNLDIKCDVFPACYHLDGMEVVGSKDVKATGNWGHVVTMNEHFCFGNICGTSMSTAYATRRYLKGLK